MSLQTFHSSGLQALKTETEYNTLFIGSTMAQSLLSRHSRFFEVTNSSSDVVEKDTFITVDRSRNVRSKDVEVLLEHIYHDRQRLIAMIPSEYSPSYLPDDPEDALYLATEYELPSMRKAMYYHFVTSPESPFDTSSESTQTLDGSSTPTSEPEKAPAGEQRVDAHIPTSQFHGQLCARLMERIIEYFTPILFTPPATPHMACTDVFADTWMRLVITPAIENNGVYKPLETLERIKGIDWEKEGLCEACVKEKNEEWSEEQQNIWKAMDAWLELTAETLT
ncbi:hypothetical protein H0H92_006361 [Tricholoma furcatifolium]|nr:hypothetical protein H0H92_006361 [Tricholoma furcatifolium]